jgi:hypothetical protein
MIKITFEMRAELQSILGSIQPFAAWHITPLEELVNRYFVILKAANSMNEYGRSCTTLNMTSGCLADFMAVSKHSGSACTYNRASFELSGDIRDLICVLKVSA